MNIKNKLKQIAYIMYFREKYVRFVRKYLKKQNHLTGLTTYDDLAKLSNQELLSLMRHEAHRIEKTIYNDIFQEKYQIYQTKWQNLSRIYQILDSRNYPQDEPTIVWSKEIYHAFNNLEQDFIHKNSLAPAQFDPSLAEPFVDFVRARRSVRVWSATQPEPKEFMYIAYQMIDAAKWAPTSGNRQPWKFLILVDQEKKELLKGIKENHCISAPLLIFVGMDTRFYGALGKSERSIYIDAGAAIMQMVLVAHKCGLGVCWNHFADDLIESREINQKIYANFAHKLDIPDYITPIAIIATGVPKFIPPEPARMELDNLLLDRLP